MTDDAETNWLLREWETVLNDLERDVALTRDRVDWVAKKFLLSAFREEEKLSWTDPWLQAIDLEYHNILPDQGLFYELPRQGSMRSIVSEEEIKRRDFHAARNDPRLFSRPIRGEIQRRDHVDSMG